MQTRILIVTACALSLAACEGASTPPTAPSSVITSPASVAGAAPGSATPARATGVPWKAHLTWTVTKVDWAGQPGWDKSTFEGRCSAPSDYVVTAKFEGEATHAGRFSGDGSHCTQIAWTPQGPGEVTWSDGRGALHTANGSSLALAWGQGVTGYDATTGETWFEDQFTFTGGTGLFEGATGGGREGGRFADFMALLNGAPAQMWMEGTILYHPAN